MKNRDEFSTPIEKSTKTNRISCLIECSNAQASSNLPLGNPVVDAAGVRPDFHLASYSGVATSRHFSLRFTLLLPLPRQVQSSRRMHGRSPPQRVEQVAGKVAERAGQAGGGGARCGGAVGYIGGTDAAAQVVAAQVVAAQVVVVREQGWCTDRLGARVPVVSLAQLHGPTCPPVRRCPVPPVRCGPTSLTHPDGIRFRLAVWPRHSSRD